MNSLEIDWVLVKLLPSHLRFEPRNVGIILHHSGAIHARFLGEAPESTGSIEADVEHALGADLGYGDWVRALRTRFKFGWCPDRWGIGKVGDYRHATVYLDRPEPHFTKGLDVLLTEMSAAGALEHLFAMMVGPVPPVSPVVAAAERSLLIADIDRHLTSIILRPTAWGGVEEQEAIARTYIGQREALLDATNPPPLDTKALRVLRHKFKITNAGRMAQITDQATFTAYLAAWIAIMTRRHAKVVNPAGA